MDNAPPPPPPPPEFGSGSSTGADPIPSASEGFIPPAGVTGWARLGSGEVVELAGLGARFGARVIDTVIYFVTMFVLSIAGIGAFGTESAIIGLYALFSVFLLIVLFGLGYEASFIALRGQTLGKMATNVKVVRADNGQLVGWGKSIGRWIIPILLLAIPFIGWILALLVYISTIWDKTRQGWHDKAAGTLVIKS